jgi:hypothetical protein
MSKEKTAPAEVAPVGTYPKVNIVELSCSADKRQSTNAEWENVLPRPINIRDTNQIAIKTGFLNDSQLSGSNIELLEDTVIALEFGYYVINGVQFCKYSGVNNMQYYYIPEWVGGVGIGPGQPTDINLIDNAQVPIISDGQMYVWHQTDPSRTSGYSPVSGRVELQLVAGSYTPQQIANIITNKLSSINNKDLQGDSIPGGALEITQLNSGSQLYRNATTDTLVNEGYWLSSYTNSNWDPGVVTRFRYVVQAKGPAPLAPDDSYSPTLFVGTDQIALDYDDVSQTFQWSFIHKPMTNPTGGAISNVLYRTTIALPLGAEYVGPLKTQSKMTGIFFTKLEPTNFWEKLGFDINSITVDISDGIDIDEVKSKTTDNQIGLSTISLRSPASNSMIVNQNYNEPLPLPLTLILTFSAENNIVPLKASRTYKASNSPFYLISLEFGPANNYSDADKVYNHIFAVVGKYFQANDFVMITGDSSIPHIHQGADYIISSFKVKILDNNKNLVRNFGPNSTIFLEIIQ